MSIEDEKGEVDNEQENDFEQDIQDAEELQLKKENAVHISGNRATTQIFVQNLDKLNLGNYQTLKDDKKNIKIYDLNDEQECVAFIEENASKECLVMAIILVSFDRVLLGDLFYLRKKFEPYISVLEDVLKADGTQYTALNNVLEVIGGQKSKSPDGKQWVGMKNGSEQAFENVMGQIPCLKSIFMEWLMSIQNDGNEMSSFGIYELTTAYMRILKLGFYNMYDEIFSPLYESSDSVGMLGLLIFRMYQDEELKEESIRQITFCLQNDITWTWRVVCIVYAYFAQDKIKFLYEKKLLILLRRKIPTWTRDDYIFVASLMFQSMAFRTQISKAYNLIYKEAVWNDKESIAKSYLRLVRISYYHVNKQEIALPLVACDLAEQQENISLLLDKIMNVYELRKQLYAILRAYLKEISTYEVSSNIMRHIAGFFFNIIEMNPDFKEDIWDFLMERYNKTTLTVSKLIFNEKGIIE